MVKYGSIITKQYSKGEFLRVYGSPSIFRSSLNGLGRNALNKVLVLGNGADSQENCMISKSFVMKVLQFCLRYDQDVCLCAVFR